MAVSHQKIDFSTFHVNEIPTGEINCMNRDFETLVDFLPSSLDVMLDGVTICPGDIEITGSNTFRINNLNPPGDKEIITVSYIENC